jgi:hypothetical protein
LGKTSRREVLSAGYAVVSNPSAGFAGALEGAELREPRDPGFATPVYSDEFRYWLVHGQPDGLDGDVSWFFGPARAEPSENDGRIPYGHFTYEEADFMCCVPAGTVKAIIRQRQAKARMACLPLPASLDPEFVRSLAKDLEHGKSVPEVAKELAIRPAEVRELVRRQQLLTVVDEEPGLRCVVQGDAVAILRANGAASVSAARTAVSPGAE